MVLGGRPHSSEWPHTQKYKFGEQKTESMVVKFKREKRHNVRKDKEVGQIYRELGEESRWGVNVTKCIA